MSPLPLPPFLSFTLSLSLGYGSNCLKLANLEEYDLGQSWNSNLIPPPLPCYKNLNHSLQAYDIASL